MECHCHLLRYEHYCSELERHTFNSWPVLFLAKCAKAKRCGHFPGLPNSTKRKYARNFSRPNLPSVQGPLVRKKVGLLFYP